MFIWFGRNIVCLYRVYLEVKLEYKKYGKWIILMIENKVILNILLYVELVYYEKEWFN